MEPLITVWKDILMQIDLHKNIAMLYQGMSSLLIEGLSLGP